MIDIENDVYLYEPDRVEDYNKVLGWITKICRLEENEISMPGDIDEISIRSMLYNLKRSLNIENFDDDYCKHNDKERILKEDYVRVMKQVRNICSYHADHDKIDFINPREILNWLQYIDRSREYQKKREELENVCTWELGEVHKIFGANVTYLKSMIVFDTEIGELIIKSQGKYLRGHVIELLETPEIFSDNNFIYFSLEDKGKYRLLQGVNSSVLRRGT